MRQARKRFRINHRDMRERTVGQSRSTLCERSGKEPLINANRREGGCRLTVDCFLGGRFCFRFGSSVLLIRPMSTPTLSWGIIGTGAIAKTFAKALPKSSTGRLVAIGSRSIESAEKFCGDFPGITAHGTYEALLADPAVQAVYISTPHPTHAEWAIKAAEAGKHILCEKPIALNHAEAMAMVEAALRNDVFLMEAFMYRCHPQTAKIVELIQSGTLGQVRMIDATFSFHSSYNLASRLLKNELGGGGILDVGCYTASIARLVAGAATGQPFAEPTELFAAGHVGAESTVDEYAAALCKFPGEIVAQLTTGVQLNADNGLKVYGSEGWMHVPNVFIPSRESGGTHIYLHLRGKPMETIEIHTNEWLYGLEADAVAKGIPARQSSAVPWEDTLGNMRLLDRWRKDLGVIYKQETPAGSRTTVSARPLRKAENAPMLYANIPGIKQPASRLIMGVDNQQSFAHSAVMFDDFFELGGNMFDTAHLYGGGKPERFLGEWIETRGIRDETLIIGKGAHTPNCHPEGITRQLSESLDRLKTSYVDLYLMHRDNPQVPVGEFVDCLNEHLKAGRIRAFGGSNWSIARVEAANAYAASKGLVGFHALSNNFSLARMVKPVWAGCISASDGESRAWFQRTQMPLFAWSSQARGFFLDSTNPTNLADESLVQSWFSEDNFRRLERARKLAEEKGVKPINIALAYVLNQPFPTFALIGPRQLSETRTSLPGLTLKLTPEEVAWLNLDVPA